jgi:signal peptidase II
MRFKILGLVIPVVFILDQLTKRIVIHFIPQGSSLPVIPGIFDLIHTRNRGAAFGFMADLPETIRVPVFLAVSLAALGLITLYFFKLREERPSVYIGLALILGGACGNLWDRIFLGEVVDFLSFHWYDKVADFRLGGWRLHFKLEWPAFNVADSAITVAVFWLMILMMSKKEKS